MPYWLFGGSHYYPNGGIRDLIAVGNNVQELVDKLRPEGDPDCPYYWMFDEATLDWWHIIDITTRCIVACDQHTRDRNLDMFPDTITDTSIVQEPYA